MDKVSLKNAALCVDEIKNLNEAEYQIYRADIAKKYNITATALDKIRKDVCNTNKDDVYDELFEEFDPYTEDVSISEVIKNIQTCLEQCLYMQPEYVLVCALWVTCTWFVDVLEISPYLLISAPEKRCGKTQLLNLLAEFAYHPLLASNVSMASLYYFADQPKTPTFLIDEADQFMDADKKEFIGILNCGYSRNTAYVMRVAGDRIKRPKRFKCFGFKAISGISIKGLSETILDRSCIVNLKRKPINQTKIKPRDLNPDLLLEIKSKLARLAIDYKEQVKTHKVQTLLDGLNDRQIDNWEPLLTLVELSQDNELLEQTKQAAIKLSKAHDENFLESSHHKTLRMIAIALSKTDKETEAISARQLADIVYQQVNQELSVRQVSLCLKSYDLTSKQTIQEDGSNKRCYSLQEIKKAIESYITEEELNADVI